MIHFFIRTVLVIIKVYSAPAKRPWFCDASEEKSKKIFYVTAKKSRSSVYDDEYGEQDEKVKEKTCGTQ